MEAAPFSRPAGEAVDFSQEDGDGIIEPGETEQEELAKAVQNPVASLISLPFQNNIEFRSRSRTITSRTSLNIQPVWPFALTDDINLITRTIVPVISQPGSPSRRRSNHRVGGHQFYRLFLPPPMRASLFGESAPLSFFRPRRMTLWATDKWGMGPSAIFLTMPRQLGHWLY